MADDKLNPSVDGYIRKNKQWQAEFKKLRAILLDFPLKEEIKWMHPCYTADGGNIVLMQEFKEYCALLFPKGALLKDVDGVLVAMTENTQAARQIRFTDVQQVVDLEPTIRAYVQEAINVEEAGLEVEFKDTADYEFPDEFQSRLEEDADLQVAFEALGVSPILLPLSDVLTGLQTGMIETIGASPVAAIALQWHTRVKYLTDTPVLYLYGTLVIKERDLEKLSLDDRKIVSELLEKVSRRLDSESRVDNQAARQALKNQGISLIMPIDEDMLQWQSIVGKAMASLRKDGSHYPSSLLDQIERHISDYRNGR